MDRSPHGHAQYNNMIHITILQHAPKGTRAGQMGESQKRTRSPISAVSSSLRNRRSQDAALRSWESGSD